MSWPTAHAPLRNAVFHLLSAPELKDTLCSFERLVVPLNMIGGGIGLGDFAEVDSKLITTAFSRRGEEYLIPFKQLKIHKAGNAVMLCRVRKRISRGTPVYELGRFGPADDLSDYPVPRSHDSMADHPLEQPSFRQVRLMKIVPANVKEELSEYLKDVQSDAVARKLREANKAARDEEKKKLTAEKRKNNDEEKKRKLSGSAVTPVPKSTRKGSKSDPSAEEIELLREFDALRKGILANAANLPRMKNELERMKKVRRGDKVDYTKKPSTMMHYIINGLPGKILIHHHGAVLVDDLQRELMHPPEGREDAKSDQVRAKVNWGVATYGATQCWIPNSTELHGKMNINKLKTSHKMVKKLKDLFGGEKCCLSKDALTILAARNLHNYGGSDEATQMIVTGTMKTLFKDIGFKVDSHHLAKGCPSQRTIARYDLNLAVDCLIKVLDEIKRDGAKKVGIIIDHGHRGGQDHFVVVVVWAGRDKNDRMAVKTFCSSIDRAGHSASQAAEGVKKVIDRHFGDEVEVFFATGDSGGGAKIQNLHPKLIELLVMKEDSVHGNCVLHGVQKATENAHKKVMGDQGMGHRSAPQMLYLVTAVTDWVQSQGGLSMLDNTWSMLQHQALDNADWEAHMKEKHGHAWEKFYEKYTALMNEGDSEGFVEFMSKAPRDIQNPVWTRWMSTIKTAIMVLDNWVTIYFLAVVIKTKVKTDSRPWKICCALISLMNERPKVLAQAISEEVEEEEIEDYIDSCTPANEPVVNENLDENDVPTFYAMLVFHRAFAQYAVTDNFNFFMQNDRYFGSNSFGHLARFCAERTCFMVQQLDKLKDSVNGWREMKEFEEYVALVKKFPTKDRVPAGEVHQEFMYELGDKFIREFERSLEEHVLGPWRHPSRLYCMLGGNKTLARQFARKLCWHDNVGAPDPESLTDSSYTFPAGTVKLGDQHMLEGSDSVELNIKDSMEYLTSDKTHEDWQSIINGRFVSEHMGLIEEFASAENEVELFDKADDGQIDKSTWQDVDYTPLVEAVWREITILAHHQQRCENMVQMAALIAKTMYGELRRTWRSITTSTIIRRFNAEAIEIMRENEADPEKKARLRRVTGYHRQKLFSEFIDDFMKDVKKARRELTTEQYDRIVDSIASKKNKASADEIKAFEDDFQDCLASDLKEYKAELESGYTMTPLMKGTVLLRILSKVNGLEDAIDAEIMARKSITSDFNFIKVYGEQFDLAEILITEKKALLKKDEARRYMTDTNKHVSFDDALKTINSIKPISDRMIEVLAQQNEILGDS